MTDMAELVFDVLNVEGLRPFHKDRFSESVEINLRVRFFLEDVG
jgi:hypothetical protein